MSHEKAYSGLKQAYINAFLPDDPPPTAYPNFNFDINDQDTPEPRELWCKVSILDGDSQPVTLGGGGEDRFEGLLQVDINIPLGTGTKPAHDVMETLRKYFIAGRGLTYLTQVVVVSSFVPSPGREVDGFYRKTVEVEFHADITRPTIP